MTLVETRQMASAPLAPLAPRCCTGEDGKPRVIGPFAVQHLLGLVAAVTRIKVSELKGLSRYKRTVRARQIYFFVARETTRKSFPLIGAHCCRDHSTVMYGYKRVKTAPKAYEPELSQILAILTERAGQ